MKKKHKEGVLFFGLKSEPGRIKTLACAAFVLWVLSLFLPAPASYGYIGLQIKHGYVVARGLVYGPDGYQIWAEYGPDGRPIRVIKEASPANGLEESYVISGQDYLAYVLAYNVFMAQHEEGIAKNADLVSREDYGRLTFKTVPTKQQPMPLEIEPPMLFPFTKSVLVRANEQLLHTGINPVLLQSGINLKNIDQRVNGKTLSVLLDKYGNVQEVSTNIIAYRMAYLVKNEAGIYDTTLDDVLYYAESMGAKPVAPMQGTIVSSSLCHTGGGTTDQDGKYSFGYYIESCPGFTYTVDTLVWAELHYRNFNPKSSKMNTYYVTSQSVDVCSGSPIFFQMGSFVFFMGLETNYNKTFHIIPVDLIMFRGEGILKNENGPQVSIGDKTAYDEGSVTEDPGSVPNRGLLKSITSDDLKDTDIYLFSENTGQMVTERRGGLWLYYVAEEGETGSMFTFRINTLGPRQELFHPGSYKSRTLPEIELFKKEVAHLRVGSRVKAVVVNRKTGYIGTTVVEIKKTVGTAGNASLDFPLGTIQLYPPNLKIWAERNSQVNQGTTKGEGRDNIISFGGSGLTSDTYIVVKTAWLDHDGSLLPNELPGYTGRLAKVVGTNQVENDNSSGHLAQFDIKPGINIQLVRFPDTASRSEHFYVQVCGQPWDRNPDFSSHGLGQGKFEYRPDYFVPFQVPVFNLEKTLANAEAQVGALAQNWQPGQPAPILENIERVYDWPFRPELQFSLFELDIDTIELLTEFNEQYNKSFTTAEFQYDLNAPIFNPLEPFGPDRQLKWSLGYARILALLGQDQKAKFPDLDELLRMQPAAQWAIMKEALGQLQHEDFLGLQLFQAGDEGNGLYEFYGLPLVLTDARPFELRRTYNLSQFDASVPATIGADHSDGYYPIDFNLLQRAEVLVRILDKDKHEKAVLVEKTLLNPGRYDFFVDYQSVADAGFGPFNDSDFLIELEAVDTDEQVRHKVQYPGRLIFCTSGEMLGQIMVHDVLIQDGSLNLSREDLNLKGRGPELGFSHSYNNQTPISSDNPLGQGWSHNFDKRLYPIATDRDTGSDGIPDWIKEKKGKFFKPAEIPPPNDNWVMVSVNGTTFKKVSGTWYAERGRHGRLVASGDKFIFTSKDGTQYEYDYPRRPPVDPEEPEPFQPAFISIHDSIITRIGLDPALLKLTDPINPPPNPAGKPGFTRLLRIIDRNGNKLHFEYGLEGGGQLTKVVDEDEADRELSFTYESGSSGRLLLTSVSGPDNIRVDFSYNGQGYLESAQRGQRSETYAYAPKGTYANQYNLAAVTDSNQHSTAYSYYNSNEIEPNMGLFVKHLRSEEMIKGVIFPGANENESGATVLFQYDMRTENKRIVTDMRQQDTAYILNYYGNPKEIREPLGRITSMTWSIDETKPDNVMTSKTDGRQFKTNYKYDNSGNIIEETDPLSHTVYTTWDQKYNQPNYRRDRNNFEEHWNYDPNNGNLLSYIDGESQTWNYTYNQYGERETQTDPNRNTIQYTYDRYGNPDTIAVPEGSVTDLDYDIRGRLVKKTDPNKNKTTYDYNDLDYPETVTYQEIKAYPLLVGSNQETFSYDPEGNKLSETNCQGLTLEYSYTPRDQVATITRKSGSQKTGEKSFSYDNNGNLESETDWKGVATTHAYDELNQRFKTTNRADDFMSMTYDNSGNLESVTDYNQKTTSYKYDALNRVTDIFEPQIPGQSAPGHIIREYNDEADPKKNLKKETDQEGNSTIYSYNGRYQPKTRTNALGHIYTWDYHANGNLKSETDEESKTVTYEYDRQNRLVLKQFTIHNSPLTISYTYDFNGNRLTTTDPLGHTITTAYDEWNRAYKVTDAEGNVTETHLDALGNPLEIIDANAGDKHYITHTYERDARGLISSESIADGPTVEYSYDENGNQKSAKNITTGLIVTTVYDAEDRPMLVTETGRIGGTRSKAILERDAMGNPKQVRDYNGNVTQTEYNALNLVWKVYDPAPFSSQYTETIYWKTGKVKEVKNRRGYATQYEYDALNRLILTRFTFHVSPLTIHTSYDNTGHVKTITDKRGIVTENTYDDLYRLVETKKAGIRIVTNEYDDAGNLTAVIDAKGNRAEHTYYKNNLLHITTLTAVDGQAHTITRTYDKVGNLVRQVNEENKETAYSYDKNNRQLSVTFAGETTSKAYDEVGNVTLITKPAGNKRKMDYDSFSRMIRVIDDPDTLRLITRYVYDANNNLIHQYDVKDHEVEFTYNELNRKTQHIQHTGSGGLTTSFEDYDEEGNLKEMRDPNGNLISYNYDELNRQIEAQYPNLNRSFNNIVKVVTEYDANNNVTKVTETKNNQGNTITDVTTNHYDNFDRLDDTIQRGVAIDYEYDLNGNRTKVSSPNGSTTYTYDERNRLKTADADGAVTVYAYLADGKKDTITYPNNTGTKYTYYVNNRIQSIVHTSGAQGPSPSTLSSYTYIYDQNGNRVWQSEIQNGVTEETDYEYDSADRMTRFAIDGPNTVETTYTFEGYDRKTEKTIENGELKIDKVYTYDDLNRLVKIVDNPSPQPQKTIDYLYDSNGNTLSKKDSSLPDGDQTFTYDSRNQLIEVKRGPPGTEESLGKYDYNAEGMRVRHRNSERGDVDYYYDDNAVLEEHKAGDNSLLAHYRYADRLLSLETTVDVQYYYQDGLGSTTNLTDQLGILKVSYRLDAWGHIRQQTGESVNRQIFTGQEHDLKTGLIYFGSRYYDPDTARFITQDSYLGEQGTPPSLHRYLYAYSNPTVFVDLEGYESEYVWGSEEDVPMGKEYVKFEGGLINPGKKTYYYSTNSGDYEDKNTWEYVQWLIEHDELQKYKKKWTLKKAWKDIYAWVKTKEKLTKEEDGGQADTEDSVDPSAELAKRKAQNRADANARGLNAVKDFVEEDFDQINEAAMNPVSVSTAATATYVIIEYTPAGKFIRKLVSKETFHQIKGRVFKKRNEEVFEKIIEGAEHLPAKYDPKFAAKQMGLDPDHFAKLPPLRQEYITNVVSLQFKVPEMEAAGMSVEQIARALHAERRSLGVKYKNLTPPELLEKFYKRNLDKYKDKLGPSIEYLRNVEKKSWEQIIESACRPGGKDLGL